MRYVLISVLLYSPAQICKKYHFCNTVYILKVIILYFKWTVNNHSDVVQFSLVVSVQISVKQDNIDVIDGILNKLKTLIHVFFGTPCASKKSKNKVRRQVRKCCFICGQAISVIKSDLPNSPK